MAVFLFDKIIFGPVKSRRLGISLGINLLPVDSKLCNFNCIYCECGWNTKVGKTKAVFHARNLVYEQLEKKLLAMSQNNEALDVITYAGNGEPTMHPEFEEIIDDTIKLRDIYFPKVRIAVLSNATLIYKPQVFSALNRIDDAILKLDSAFPETIKLLNNPMGSYRMDRLIEQFKHFQGKLIIQTMFVKGTFEGQVVDNTTDKELTAWIEILHQIKPRQVMIYTIERDTPSPNLEKVELADLIKISERLEKEGFNVQVSG